jgi:propionyl-CoA carboxylase beta chain
MGAEGAVNILYRRELAESSDPVTRRAELIEAYNDELSNPWIAAERGYVDRVILPRDTRAEIAKVLRLLRTKRASLPPKKHGNIPL